MCYSQSQVLHFSLFLVLVADFFVLVFVNGIVIFSFLAIFVFVNENHTASLRMRRLVRTMSAEREP